MQPASLTQTFGRYELLTLLARGGMAEVFLARMTGVGGFAKLLVIKRILPHLRDDPEFHAMFLNEGRIAARLNHPNVCHVYELGEVDGDMFLAMEYLEGLAWSELVDRVPRTHGFQLRCAAGVLGQICEGLHYAHELRDVDGTPTPVVHRDVSPQNVMLTTDGVCKLLDFGVSKVLTEGTRTRTGMLKGKLPYMAPEQIRGEAVDARSDVFSMGVVLWEAMTGERLFKRDSDYLIWRAITEDAIPRISATRPGLPPAIDEVAARALERDPARRYPSVKQLAADLRRVAEAVGGPLDHAALAETLRALAGPQLAERARTVGAALGRPLREPIAVVTPEPPEPSDTHSIQLREASVRLGGRRRRRLLPWAVALTGAASLGVLAALVSLETCADDAPLVAAVPGVPDAAAGLPDGGHGEVPDLPDAGDAGEVPGRPDAVADAGAPAREVHRPAERARRTAKAPEPGQYSVDSRPYATIYIDGKSYGDTPLFRVALPAGKHRVRAVRADGKARTLSIAIEPGKLVSSGTLAW